MILSGFEKYVFLCVLRIQPEAMSCGYFKRKSWGSCVIPGDLAVGGIFPAISHVIPMWDVEGALARNWRAALKSLFGTRADSRGFSRRRDIPRNIARDPHVGCGRGAGKELGRTAWGYRTWVKWGWAHTTSGAMEELEGRIRGYSDGVDTHRERSCQGTEGAALNTPRDRREGP
jgi:hypothetical protein